MRRRTLLQSAVASGTASLAAPRLAAAQARPPLRFVPQADIAITDPHTTTGIVTRNHALMVFDTLYGVDADLRPQPQMVQGHTVEDGGRRWTMTLRESLRFHDGEPVRARDAVASLRRWSGRNSFANALMTVVDELSAADDRTILWRLKRPFPMLPEVLGNTGTPCAAIMPERLARTDVATILAEVVGSGPFRFVADERIPGSRTVYARFDGYVPRPGGAPSLMAGPKVATIDRVEWLNLPDAATAAAALQRGEIDWWEQPPSDLLPTLKRARGIALEVLDPSGAVGMLRFNHTQPPFDDPAVRRALLPAISQTDAMTAAAGTDGALWRDDVGYFLPGSPLASDAGLEALRGPRDTAAARRALQAAGYGGERVQMMAPTDFASINAMSEVVADELRRCGINLDYAAMDWGSMLRRMANREDSSRGGWDVFVTYALGSSHMNPAAHNFLRGSGADATFGWPTSGRLEALRGEWLFSEDPSAAARIGREMQTQALQDLPYIPLGLFYQPTAYRDRLSGLLKGAPLFWNLKAAA
jgi:peptide/nickel transport system substrate-binding protein